MIKRIITAFAVLGVVGLAIGYYMYNKPKTDVANEKPEVVVNAPELLSTFNTDEPAAMVKYGNKVIEVSGVVKEISTTAPYTVMLDCNDDMAVVSCNLKADENNLQGINVGDEVNVKGICVGLNVDINLTNCVIVK